jgi:hypothetical protein
MSECLLHYLIRSNTFKEEQISIKVPQCKSNIQIQKKQILYGDSVNKIIKYYETKQINPSSKYLLIRESHTAKSADIYISKSLADSLNIDITAAKSTSKIGSENIYTLKKEFSKPLGICNITYEIKIEKGITGRNKVSIGNPVEIPRDAVMQSR